MVGRGAGSKCQSESRSFEGKGERFVPGAFPYPDPRLGLVCSRLRVVLPSFLSHALLHSSLPRGTLCSPSIPQVPSWQVLLPVLCRAMAPLSKHLPCCTLAHSFVLLCQEQGSCRVCILATGIRQGSAFLAWGLIGFPFPIFLMSPHPGTQPSWTHLVFPEVLVVPVIVWCGVYCAVHAFWGRNVLWDLSQPVYPTLWERDPLRGPFGGLSKEIKASLPGSPNTFLFLPLRRPCLVFVNLEGINGRIGFRHALRPLLQNSWSLGNGITPGLGQILFLDSSKGLIAGSFVLFCFLSD